MNRGEDERYKGEDESKRGEDKRMKKKIKVKLRK